MSKIAFVFPGQGSQEVGMGRALFENVPAARAVFEQADDILGFSLSTLCFAGPEDRLNETSNTQVAIYTASMAALAALRAAGFDRQPDFVAGHSLGEYSAYAAAGVFSFEAGLRLVNARGRLMKKAGELNPGGMAAFLKLDDETVAGICQTVTAAGDYGSLQVANYNSPGQVVVSGNSAAVKRGIELALEAKARRAVQLPVSIAAHSELMRVVAAEFRQAVEATPLSLPEMPVVANITAAPLESLADMRQEMEDQLTSSVNWTGSVSWMVAQGVDTFVEIGPNNVLTGLIKRIDTQVRRFNIGKPEDIDSFLNSVTS